MSKFQDTSIKNVIAEINKTFFVPNIQREYVWLSNPKEKKIEQLFDSILHGYPIGCFLFWTLKKSDIQNNPDLNFQLYKFIEKYDIKSAEIPFIWESFIQNLCNLPCKWIFLTFDYGDFLPREMNIRMYMQHKVYNLYEELQNDRLTHFIGKSDITYDIDFSLLKKILENNNAKVLCNVTQSKFLIESCEILDIFESFSTHFSTIQLSKQKASLQGLIAPNAMGERFKALVCGV